MAVFLQQTSRNILFGLALSLLLSGCATDVFAPNRDQSLKTLALPAPISGLDKILRLDPAFVVFGELHGTNEAPRFFGDVAVAVASQGKHVLVAVELSAPENEALKKAWVGSHAEFSSALKGSEWTIRRDGVTSVAMRDMLVRLHGHRASGADLSIVAFNGSRDDAQRLRLQTLGPAGGHEAAQAENVADAARVAGADITLVLVGSTHAEKTPISFGGANYDPMAMVLAKSGKLVSLNMVYAGGTAWNCQLKAGVKFDPAAPVTAAMLDCANHPVAGLKGKDGAPYMAIGALPGVDFGGRYDGYFWLGAISGSDPAVP